MIVRNRSGESERKSVTHTETEGIPLTSNAEKSAIVELRLDGPEREHIQQSTPGNSYTQHQRHTSGSSRLSPNLPMLCTLVSQQVLKLDPSYEPLT